MNSEPASPEQSFGWGNRRLRVRVRPHFPSRRASHERILLQEPSDFSSRPLSGGIRVLATGTSGIDGPLHPLRGAISIVDPGLPICGDRQDLTTAGTEGERVHLLPNHRLSGPEGLLDFKSDWSYKDFNPEHLTKTS